MTDPRGGGLPLRGGGLPARRDHILALALLTLIVLLASTWREVWDEPLGQDANRYLKNALAVARGDPSDYHAWRGPLHAGLTALLGQALGLIPASKALSIAATTATVPLTWLLGRATVGERAALLGAALLALWPDLWWLARFSTPYALLTLLVTAGTAAAAHGGGHLARGGGHLARGGGHLARGGGHLARGGGLPARRWPPLVAALCFALAVGTDLRAQALAVAVALVALIRRDAVTAGAVLGGVAVARAILAALPVELEPLPDQIAEHSRLLAAGDPACHAMAGRLPAVSDLFGECARVLLIDNLSRALLAWVALPALAILAVAGLWRAPKERWFLAAPALTLLPALALTLTYQRYVQPVAPALLLLVGAGLERLLGRRAPIGVVALAGLALASPGSPFARSMAPPVDHAVEASLGVPRPITLATRVVQAGAGGQDRVADCATADLAMRLYPREADEIGLARKLSARCAKLLAEGPGERRTWVLARTSAEDPLWPGWAVAWRHREPDGRELLVLSGP